MLCLCPPEICLVCLGEGGECQAAYPITSVLKDANLEHEYHMPLHSSFLSGAPYQVSYSFSKALAARKRLVVVHLASPRIYQLAHERTRVSFFATAKEGYLSSALGMSLYTVEDGRFDENCPV